MAGGNFDIAVGKVRPGTYINFESSKQTTQTLGSRGVAAIPLFKAVYGPAKQWIEISSDSPDGAKTKLGFSVYDDDENRQMLLIREALKHATTVYVYVATEGNKATASVSGNGASDIVKDVTDVVKEKIAGKGGLTGCSIAYDEATKTGTVTLSGPASEVKNTGLFDALEVLTGMGYVATVDGVTITGLNDFASTDAYKQLMALTVGGSATFTITLTLEGESEDFTIVFDYPAVATESETGSVTVNSGDVTLKATAPYGGSRGNTLTVSVTADSLQGYDVTVSLDGTKVAYYEQLATIEDLIAQECAYVSFTGSGNLFEVAALNLAGGTDVETSNEDVTAYLDALEAIGFNTAAFPVDDSSLKAAAKQKVTYMRSSMGKGVQIVVPDFDNADYEGIISVTNSYKTDDDGELTHAEACAWVAGATAGASYNESLTYDTVDDAIEVVDPKTHEEAVAAINAGEFFFSVNESRTIVVEDDINSLVSYGYGTGKDKGYRKNRIIRVFDSFQSSVQENFPPNKYNNNETGWDIMEGQGRAILKLYEDADAIKNVDYDNDFAVDREMSEDDQVYFNVGLQPVDSAEKLYFTVKTR